MNRVITRVLMVEDNPGDARMARSCLPEDWFDLDICDNLEGAASLLIEKVYDVILLDLSMAEGTNAITEIKRVTGLPIVVFTGRGELELVEDCLLAGADAFEPKEHTNGNLAFSLLGASIRHKRPPRQSKSMQELHAQMFITEG